MKKYFSLHLFFIICATLMIIEINFCYAMFELPKLKFAPNELEPHISSKTIEIHHGKHHKTYVDNLNKLMESGEFKGKTLEEIIKSTYGKPDKIAFYNNAGQIWNHNFYWESISHKKQQIGDKLKIQIEKDFGSVEKFIEQLSSVTVGQFGSGWGWVVWDKKEKIIKITKTSNADSPLTSENLVALLTIDVWEHAYYIDYQNRRADYVKTFLSEIINWEFIARGLEKNAQ